MTFGLLTHVIRNFLSVILPAFQRLLHQGANLAAVHPAYHSWRELQLSNSELQVGDLFFAYSKIKLVLCHQGSMEEQLGLAIDQGQKHNLSPMVQSIQERCGCADLEGSGCIREKLRRSY